MDPTNARQMHRLIPWIARGWAPPKAREWLVRQFGGIRRVDRWPTNTDAGWAAAAGAAADGYNEGVRRISESAIVGLVPDEGPTSFSDASKQLHDRLVQFALVAARTGLGQEQLRVLDYGGGFGSHAEAVSRLVPGLAVQYTVAELPEFCRVGRTVNPRVGFVAGLADAGTGYHLVYASSSVQYTENWRELVAGLCRATAKTLFITRTPFTVSRPAFVTMQRAYKTEYPGWVFNLDEFVGEVTHHGLALREVFLNGPGISVRGVGNPNTHLGLLFEKTELGTR